MEITLGIGDNLYPAEVELANGRAFFKMKRLIPVGKYANQWTIELRLTKNKGVYDLAGQIVNETINHVSKELGEEK